VATTDKTKRFQARTKQFGLRALRLCDALPKTLAGAVIGRQLLRSALSVGANYRAACRAKSRADFISKMGTVEEETDESLYWMEMLTDAGLVKKERLEGLIGEAREITAMVVASIRTARSRSK
jgi:four helix bundle protein